MRTVEIILTLAILLVAVAWAARKLLRVGRGVAAAGSSDDAPGCSTGTGGCGSCPIKNLQVKDKTPGCPPAQEDET